MAVQHILLKLLVIFGDWRKDGGSYWTPLSPNVGFRTKAQKDGPSVAHKDRCPNTLHKVYFCRVWRPESKAAAVWSRPSGNTAGWLHTGQPLLVPTPDSIIVYLTLIYCYHIFIMIPTDTAARRVVQWNNTTEARQVNSNIFIHLVCWSLANEPNCQVQYLVGSSSTTVKLFIVLLPSKRTVVPVQMSDILLHTMWHAYFWSLCS